MIRFLVYFILFMFLWMVITSLLARAETITIHVLEYQDRPASLADMTKEQCELLKEEVEVHNGTMDGLLCVPYEVRREAT